jgi:hypothetical protein
VAFRQQKRAFVLSDEPSVAGKEKGKRNFLSPQIEMEKGSMATKISEEFGCRPIRYASAWSTRCSAATASKSRAQN